MSKSSPHPSSKILLTDEPTLIQSKFRTALTDSLPGLTYDPVNRPGVSALLDIYAGYSGQAVHDVAATFDGRKEAMREFKESLADVVAESLRGFRAEFERLRGEPGYVDAMEKDGARRAAETAAQTMAQVKVAVGTQ